MQPFQQGGAAVLQSAGLEHPIRQGDELDRSEVVLAPLGMQLAGQGAQYRENQVVIRQWAGLAAMTLAVGGEQGIQATAVEIAPAVGRWVWPSAAPLPPRSGYYYLCLRWQADSQAPLLRCRPVWIRR